MRAAVLVLGLALATAGASAQPAATTTEQLVFVRDGDLWSAAPDGSAAERLTRSAAAEADPALSPDGELLSFASNRTGENEVYRASLDGWTTKQLSRNPGRNDVEPAWSPVARTLAWSSNGDVYAMNGEGNARRPVATTAADERDPAWSPDGREIAYSADGDLFITTIGGMPRRLTTGPEQDGAPDWSHHGEVAFERDGAVYVVAAAGGEPRRVTAGPADADPAWSPDGRRLVFSRARPGGSDLLVVAADGTGVGMIVPGAGDPEWGARRHSREEPEPLPDELLPDLDQRAPAGLTITTARGRFKLGFVSAADNIGRGPVWIVASRRSAAAVMRATQLVALRGGRRRAYPNAGVVRYTPSASHSHWHYLRFMSYELRSADDFTLLVRDRKSGFCLADHYGLAAARMKITRPQPRFLGNCASGNPRARWVEQGSSVGYTDRYPAHFHGQNLDVTGLPAGTYWIVHRANPSGLLRELRTTNNSAAVLVSLRWQGGPRKPPTVAVLRVCEGAERCAAAL